MTHRTERASVESLAAAGDTNFPFVSVVIPVRNEAPCIEKTLLDVLAQDYPPDRLEVIVADGESTDRTREIVRAIARAHPSIRLIDNPGKFVSSGLNRALSVARGEIFVRVDGHWEYPTDYVRRVVALREQSGAANAGGVLEPIGNNYVQRSVCAALSAPVGVAGSAMRGRRPADDVREVDHVSGGCWRRETLLGAGGFAEEMVRNQDDEMSFRLRKAGGRIVQSSSIRFQYVVRDRWAKLFRQYLQYGYWKVRVVRKHPRQASARHLGPAILVGILMAGGVAAPFSATVAQSVLVVAGVYLSCVAIAAFLAALRSGIELWPGVFLTFLLMHLCYGGGSLMGLVALVAGPRMDAWFSRLTR